MRLHQRVDAMAIHLFYVREAWCIGDAVDYLMGISNIKPSEMEIVLSPSHFEEIKMMLVSYVESDMYSYYDGKMLVKITIGDIASFFKDNYVAYQPKFELVIRKTD